MLWIGTMDVEINEVAPLEREWIATIPTFVRSEARDEELTPDNTESVKKGARLRALLSEDGETFWRIKDGTIDGKPLPCAICVLDKAHWMLMPTKFVVPTLPKDIESLTVDRLVAGRWSFGLDRNPWTSDLRFMRDGKTAGQAGPHHRFWSLQKGHLSLFTRDRRLSWISDVVTMQGDTLRLAGLNMISAHASDRRFLTELPPVLDAVASTLTMRSPTISAPSEAVSNKLNSSSELEIVKLIIWDLDDTFWHGTLSEGGINAIKANISLVKEMSARGIVNSICSKNEFETTKAELVRLGVWDYFVFPKIAFAPKGALIKDIIEAAQLRTASVLFIDDNRMNINEALHYNPGLQVCEPEAILGLLDDPRCKGKPDPELKRLAQYKVLEKKATDQVAAGNDNLDFLRQSEVRVSFHYDVMEEFTRIHDLVNRTNQLNFTQKRWPEDPDAARAVFQEEQDRNFNSHCGYVKVADRYGEYGIVGFFLVSRNVCRHFLFSCRTLNMGIEQFVWQKLGRPRMKVVANLGDNPGWITVVDDADTQLASTGVKKKICVRGACDLAMMTHYLRTRFETVEEFNYPYKRWAINPVARAVAVYEETQTPAGQQLLQRLDAVFPPHRFTSDVNAGTSDHYVFSFSPEVFPGMYRSKSTGMILPFAGDYIGKVEFKSVDYQKIALKAEAVGLSRETWEFLQDEFEFIGARDKKLFAADVETIFTKLCDKNVIVLLLNTKIGNGFLLLNQWAQFNEIVRPLALKHGVHTIEINDYVKTFEDLSPPPASNGAHFKREIYRQLADRVTEIISKYDEAKELKAKEAMELAYV